MLSENHQTKISRPMFVVNLEFEKESHTVWCKQYYLIYNDNVFIFKTVHNNKGVSVVFWKTNLKSVEAVK